MELITTRIKGMEDVVPSQVHKWHTVEKVASDIAEAYGFREIRIPTFENTELFVRSVGETTDVVQKEMFTVTGRESKFTLRPEGTAGTIRAVLQNGLLNEALPQKVFYILSCFRHEKPQAGRLWEFHQFGAEMAGSSSPAADAEMISMAGSVIEKLGIKDIELHINSIGCPHCRAKYYEKLREFFEPNKEKLCPTCLSRLEKNPMRILDCKSEICREIGKEAPLMIDYLCDECSEHFTSLKKYLDEMGIVYSIDPKIVRGLDYYTKTVFEFITTSIGAQGTVCGGGRYDGLIGEMGGNPTPALGFAMGLERLIMTMEKQGCEFAEPRQCDIYIGSMGEAAGIKAAALVNELRTGGVKAEWDVMGRGVKAQMKYANKIGAAYSIILGDNELAEGKAKLKNMQSGEESEIALDSSFCDRFSNIRTADMLALDF
ncbi:MAG: histidine--tRNA ligase [Oscillospiraceae bacterium]|nr:histidine--tRNA ligase [Oscillospiraceae bacterium]